MELKDYKHEDIVKEKIKDKSLVDIENFLTPSMGDYYGEESDFSILRQVEKSLNGEEKNGKAALFFIENPYSTKLGYHEDAKVFVIKAEPVLTREAKALNEYDGDTIHFYLDSILDGGEGFEIGGQKYYNFRDYANIHSSDIDEYNGENRYGILSLRTLGVNAPEIPHYTSVPDLGLKRQTLSYSKLLTKNSQHYNYDTTKEHKDSDEITFVKLSRESKDWHEVIALDFEDSSEEKRIDEDKEGNKVKYIYIVSKDDSVPWDKEYQKQGIQAKDTLASLLLKATDMRLVLDAKSFSHQGGYSSYGPYDDDYYTAIGTALGHPIQYIKQLWDDIYGEKLYDHLGYNSFGQDAYKRFLGTIYIKIYIEEIGEEVWINTAKYLVSNYSKFVPNPDYSGDPLTKSKYDFAADAFKLWSYDPTNIEIADALENTSKEQYNKRKRIQQEIMNMNIEQMQEHTVILGDCLFMVPPTSIKVTTQTTTERVPLLRSKSSMTKSTPKVLRTLELHLYFNGKIGINGVPKKMTLPNGKEIIYYMNGLRALLAQFKFIPFLPIENDYINRILNIESVSLVNLQITTTPGFPETLSAILTLQEFDYRVYMPELPAPDYEKDMYKHLFASTINFDVMRWYYQRAIFQGEELKDIPYNSKEYIDKTLGNKTSLQPMTFGNSSIEFYVADKETLDQQLELKLQSAKKQIKALPILSDNMTNAIEGISYAYAALERTSYQTYKALEKLNDSNPFISSIDGISSIYTKGAYSNEILISHLQSESNTNEDETKLVNNVFGPIINIMTSSEVPGIEGVRVEETIFNDTVNNLKYVYLDMWLDIYANAYNLTEEELSNIFILHSSTSSYNLSTDVKEMINAHQLKIRFIATFKKGDKFYSPYELVEDFELDTDSSGYQILQSMARSARTMTGETINSNKIFADINNYGESSGASMQETLIENKKAIDLENINSLKFVKYEIGNVVIMNQSAVCRNTLTKTSLQMSSGEASQYLGGQDTLVEVTLQTKDESSVVMLNHLPQLASQYARDYRQVLNVWPLRIKSELTKLLGINEVTIENVISETVPGQPGLYNIILTLLSVDRTQRNREALQKIETPSNAGKIKTQNNESLQSKSYFDIKETLSKVELYPDLELPTLEELEFEAGFKFVKFSSHKLKRTYPDPDFYFSYSHVLGHEIFKKTILDSIKESLEKSKIPDFTFTDKFGASITLTPDEQYGYKIKEINATAKKMKAMQEAIQSSKNSFESKNNDTNVKQELKAMNYTELIKNYNEVLLFEQWDISKDIKCSFSSKKEISELNKNSEIRQLIENRNSNIIIAINKELTKPMKKISNKNNFITEKKIKQSSFGLQYHSAQAQSDYIKKSISEFVDDFFGKDKQTGFQIVKNLYGTDPTNKILKSIKELLYASAAARIGEYEYRGRSGKYLNKWAPKMYRQSGSDYKDSGVNANGLIPFAKVNGKLGNGLASSINDALEYGFELGSFGIKVFSKKGIKQVTGIEPSQSKQTYILDEYYRNLKDDNIEILTYKQNVLLDPYWGAYAFTRNMLYYLKKLIQKQLLISPYDIEKETFYKELKKREFENLEATYNTISGTSSEYDMSAYGTSVHTTSEYNEKETSQKNNLPIILKTAIEERNNLLIGRMFTAYLLTLTNGNKKLFSLIENRNYPELNGFISSVKQVIATASNQDPILIATRKFVRALSAGSLIENLDDIAYRSDTSGDDYKQSTHERLYIAAADNPGAYIQHSFYDMIVHDKRGRMLRAFPTYYMMFIDEGREIGKWKLHDNFYNMSAIGEIQVVKSRKIAADTATITMTNMFKTYTTDDEDIREDYEYDWKDAFSSIFSPRTYYIREELRSLEASSVEKIRLQPGVRMHLRVGYGANASSLPIIFNGNISEVSTGEVVKFVAQGDGRELTNPIFENHDAEDIQNNDKFFVSKLMMNWITQGASPKTILSSLLTTKGGWTKSFLNNVTDGYFFNRNPYGIAHFGDPEYQPIFSEGECVQNIYEAIDKPNTIDLNGMSEMYEMDDIPLLSAHLYGKTYWDIMNICASASPDFIASTIPFQFRSSVFYGAPRYYVAYDYEKKGSTIVEKRKPFQQYHIYNSFSDIIANSIKTSDREVKTCAVGSYSAKGWVGRENLKKLAPMWVDFDIYPEYQKTMTVDTQLVTKGTALGDIIPFIDWLDRELSTFNHNNQGHALAWRMTANALKNSVKDMYQGEVIVLGDPTIKPYDRFWISDTYESMEGAMDVEAVVHNFNPQTGFTTSVYPDCIAQIDDQYDRIGYNIANEVVAKASVLYTVTVSLSMSLAKDTRPLLTALSGFARSSGVRTNTIVNSVGKLLDKDVLKYDESVSSFVDNILTKTGISSTTVEEVGFSRNLKGWTKSLNFKIGNESASELANRYRNLENALNRLSPNKLIQELSQYPQDEKITEIINSLNKYSDDITKAGLKKLPKIDISEIENILFNAEVKAGTDPAKLQRIKTLKGQLSTLSASDDIGKQYHNIATIIEELDDLVDVEDLKYFAKNTDKAFTVFSSKLDDLAKITENFADGDVLKSLKALKLGASAGMASMLGMMVFEMAASWIFTSFVYEYVERWMKNLQVLQIYPIKKEGRSYTAGLNGSKGIVVGAPSYDDPGLIEGTIVDFFDKEVSGPLNFARDVLTTAKMKQIADNYERSAKQPNPDSLVDSTKIINETLFSIATQELKIHNQYLAMLYIPRVDIKNPSEENKEVIANTFSELVISRKTNIQLNSKIKEEFIPLTESVDLNNYIEADLLKLIYSTDDIEETNFFYKMPSETIEFESKNIKVTPIYDGGIKDYPLLRPDAYTMLLEILKRLDNIVNTVKSKHNKLNRDSHPVLLQSALRLEDKWGATGLSFSLSSNYHSENIYNILTELDAEQKELNKQLGISNPLFGFRRLSNNYSFDIIVFPKI